jgi:hypothetical protein
MDISSVGTVSKMKAYGNNRADGTFMPGGMIPGYLIIQPHRRLRLSLV